MTTYVYHERQLGGLCGVHCLNNLLQGPRFGPGDLAEIGVQLDQQERLLMEDSNAGTSAGEDGAPEPYNVDPSADGGNFSIQVLTLALNKYSLELLPAKHPRGVVLMKDPPKAAQAFLCQYRDHWFAIREVADCWWNLNSTRVRPGLVSPFYLAAWLAQLSAEGYSIFLVIGGELPPPAKPLTEGKPEETFHELFELLERAKDADDKPISSTNSDAYLDEAAVPPDMVPRMSAFAQSAFDTAIAPKAPSHAGAAVLPATAPPMSEFAQSAFQAAIPAKAPSQPGAAVPPATTPPMSEFAQSAFHTAIPAKAPSQPGAVIGTPVQYPHLPGVLPMATATVIGPPPAIAARMQQQALGVPIQWPRVQQNAVSSAGGRAQRGSGSQAADSRALREMGFREPQIEAAQELSGGSSSAASEMLMRVRGVPADVESNGEKLGKALQQAVLGIDTSVDVKEKILHLVTILSLDGGSLQKARSFVDPSVLTEFLFMVLSQRGNSWPTGCSKAASLAVELLASMPSLDTSSSTTSVTPAPKADPMAKAAPVGTTALTAKAAPVGRVEEVVSL